MLTLAEISKEAGTLPPEQRGELVESLIQSFNEPASNPHKSAWLHEIRRRSEELRSGKVQAVDGKEVAQRVRRLIAV